MHEPGPISLSEALSHSSPSRWRRPIDRHSSPRWRSSCATSRSPWVTARFSEWRSSLLTTGHYNLKSTVATGIAAAHHNGRSQLRNGAPILNSRSK